MKKLLPIIIILLIIVVLIVLTRSGTDDEVVISDTGEKVVTGIVADDSSSVIPSEVDGLTEDAGGFEIGILIGNKAPNFRLESFDGEVIVLNEINKPMVIDFWAGWCPFCIEELPDLEAAHQEFGDAIEFIGIHRSETESIDKGLEFANDKGVTYTLLKDSTGDVYNTYSGGQPFMPLAFYIDENGVIVERVIGPKSAEKIRSSVNKLIN